MIRARTAKESEAFEAGYAQAVIDVQAHGLVFAVGVLRLMDDSYPHVPPEGSYTIQSDSTATPAAAHGEGLRSSTGATTRAPGKQTP